VGAEGTLVTFDGKTDAFRRRVLRARPGCKLCGTGPAIRSIERNHYT
jgi:hypothetical protein